MGEILKSLDDFFRPFKHFFCLVFFFLVPVFSKESRFLLRIALKLHSDTNGITKYVNYILSRVGPCAFHFDCAGNLNKVHNIARKGCPGSEGRIERKFKSPFFPQERKENVCIHGGKIE